MINLFENKGGSKKGSFPSKPDLLSDLISQ